jgi:propionate catabolism operon transcriptional regulator
LQALTPTFVASVAPELAPASLLQQASATAPVEEKDDVIAVLSRFGGDRAAAARHLGISRTTLWRRLRSEAGAGPEG